MQHRRACALITGASGGLGHEFATLFARDGYDVVLVARNEDKLSSLASDLEERFGITAYTFPCDLSRADCADTVAEFVRQRGIHIDVLVNNAGFGGYGLFHQTPFDHERDMLAVNVCALTALSKAFVPGMVERGRGGILNVASIAAFEPGPLMAVYYATKSYVLQFSIALSVELEGTGVTVTCVCPGLTNTGFKDHAGLGASRLFGGSVMEAPQVAAMGYRAFRRGKALVVTGWRNAFLAQMTRFASRRFAARVARFLQRSA